MLCKPKIGAQFRKSRRSLRRLQFAKSLDCEGLWARSLAQTQGDRACPVDGWLYLAEVHWHEAAGIRRKKFKIKHLL
jgi:hypothetical protein